MMHSSIYETNDQKESSLMKCKETLRIGLKELGNANSSDKTVYVQLLHFTELLCNRDILW